MFAFRYLIRKFFEMEMYCTNSLVKNCSVIFTIAKNSLNEFFKVVEGALFEIFTGLSANKESVNNSIETIE